MCIECAILSEDKRLTVINGCKCQCRANYLIFKGYENVYSFNKQNWFNVILLQCFECQDLHAYKTDKFEQTFS